MLLRDKYFSFPSAMITTWDNARFCCVLKYCKEIYYLGEISCTDAPTMCYIIWNDDAWLRATTCDLRVENRCRCFILMTLNYDLAVSLFVHNCGISMWLCYLSLLSILSRFVSTNQRALCIRNRMYA